MSALGDPVRLSIVSELARGARTAGDLCEPFRVSRPAISRHLRVLREAGIATATVRGREWWYMLNTEHLARASAWLEEVRSMWETTLMAFKNYVEEVDGQS